MPACRPTLLTCTAWPTHRLDERPEARGTQRGDAHRHLPQSHAIAVNGSRVAFLYFATLTPRGACVWRSQQHQGKNTFGYIPPLLRLRTALVSESRWSCKSPTWTNSNKKQTKKTTTTMSGLDSRNGLAMPRAVPSPQCTTRRALRDGKTLKPTRRTTGLLTGLKRARVLGAAGSGSASQGLGWASTPQLSSAPGPTCC